MGTRRPGPFRWCRPWPLERDRAGSRSDPGAAKPLAQPREPGRTATGGPSFGPDGPVTARSGRPRQKGQLEARPWICVVVGSLPDDSQPANAADALQPLEGIPVRPGTELAALVVALRRLKGTTNLQLMLATGWQLHTVRGAISGQVRKNLGLDVVVTKVAGGETGYRIG
jgi:hypothetical protein